jgi:hypothetical protein
MAVPRFHLVRRERSAGNRRQLVFPYCCQPLYNTAPGEQDAALQLAGRVDPGRTLRGILSRLAGPSKAAPGVLPISPS